MMIIFEGVLFILAGWVVVMLVLKAVEVMQGDD
jgi:hypothetical protein